LSGREGKAPLHDRLQEKLLSVVLQVGGKIERPLLRKDGFKKSSATSFYKTERTADHLLIHPPEEERKRVHKKIGIKSPFDMEGKGRWGFLAILVVGKGDSWASGLLSISEVEGGN